MTTIITMPVYTTPTCWNCMSTANVVSLSELRLVKGDTIRVVACRVCAWVAGVKVEAEPAPARTPSGTITCRHSWARQNKWYQLCMGCGLQRLFRGGR